MPQLPLGIGVIGCGVISEIYLKRCETFPQIKAVAVADMNLDAARKRGDQFGIPALSVDDLLARPDVDIVLNLTIPAAHVEIGLKAVAAGKHVYAEKPLGVSFAEAKTLIDAAKAKGLRIGSAPDTFLGGSHQTARALIDAQAIGRPIAGTSTLMWAGHELWHPNPDFYYAAAGGGPAMDMAPYYITDLVNLLGPVKRVISMASRAETARTIATGPRKGESVPVQVDTHLAGVLEFANGALIQIVTSFDIKGHKHTPLELYGTTGSMIIPDPNTYTGAVELLVGKAWVEQPYSHGYGDDNYRGIGLADLADAIVNNRPHRTSGDLALHVIEVIEALHKSAHEGCALTMTSSVEQPAPLAPGLKTGEIA